jgi:ATP-dependent DNA helicase RecG
MSTNLEAQIDFLKGVGSRKAELLKKDFGIFTFNDLLHYYPYKYIDKSKFYHIKDLNNNLNTYIQLKGQITKLEILGEGRGRRLVAHFQDETGVIQLVWFNNLKSIGEWLRKNVTYIVFGKPTVFGRAINITHPELREEETEEDPKLRIPFQPFYNTSEKAKKSGLDSRSISRLCFQLLAEQRNNIHETLPPYILEKLKLIDRRTALVNIHFPKDMQVLQLALNRLKFEEIFFMQLNLLQLHRKREKSNVGFYLPKVGTLFNEFYHKHLPFPLTDAQKRVIKEIRADFISGHQMNRLLQGDVGSGKTITALLLMLIAMDNGFQCCLMAPTEILANQHFETLKKQLESLPIRVELLTGSTKQSQRKHLLPAIENGEVHILVGTHALGEDAIVFDKLGLVVIDEQHRFGVEQRARLWKKNLTPPHVLVMTATPIPRTLAMTVYGDLDVSVIDELPKGRVPIVTYHYYQNQRIRILEFLRKQIAEGRQIYVVFPLINESETMDFRNLVEGYDAFKVDFPEPKYKISCVHGKLSAEEKEREMQKFVRGESQIMLATTVIEVGIDVPNASVMVIENAERFGLSQLHQLRGRVGRGASQSYCILLSDVKLTAESRKRLEAMVTTNDGFEIAEYDLKLRGPGDLAGTKQSGMINFKLINILKDEKIITAARNLAKIILEKDPTLALPENIILRTQLEFLRKNQSEYYQIG